MQSLIAYFKKEAQTLEAEVPAKILIVDDHPDNLRVMESILEDQPYQVITAGSGRDALKLILRHDFALIFMDVRMPIMDGLETVRIIRQREKSAFVPIIFLTAYAREDAGQIVQGYSLGAVDYLVKPVAPEVLRSKSAAFADLYRKNEILREQKELLRQSHHELERRVQERTEDLARANNELSAANQDLKTLMISVQESLTEKELLLKEIHHRVKNNLQIVSSILSLQSNYIKDERLLDVFHESQARIKSIAIIHELLYEQGHLARIEFKDYLENLVENIFRTIGADPRNIQYTVDCDSALMELDAAIHLGLIVNELLTNAIKYAFPDGRSGKINVTLKTIDDDCTLTVEDDGVGLPPDFTVRSSKSMGLQLVDMLITQLRATLELGKEGGARFVIRFPYPRAQAGAA